MCSVQHRFRPNSQRLVAALLLIVLASGSGAQASTRERSPINFAEIVSRNFANWDRNRDGILSAEEIDGLVKNPKVTGTTAAAVAAIHRYFRSDKAPAGVSEYDLTVRSDAPSGRRDVNQHRPRFNSDYSAFCRHLKAVPRRVFTEDECPKLLGMSQGRLGDCYFVSTIGAAVRLDRQAVRRMLHVRPDGSTDVVFPGGRSVHVNRLTDAEIALGSTAGDQGLWLNILEKALAKVFAELPTTKKLAADIDLDLISRGGSSARVITLLTGHAATVNRIWQRKGKAYVAPTNADLPKLRTRFHDLFCRLMEEGSLMCAGTPATGKFPPGIVSHHSYAILSYDPENQVVHLWNPWGNKFEPKGPRIGLAYGYPTRNGRFEMPLEDFLRVFASVHSESPESVAQFK